MSNEYKINQHDMTILESVKTPSYVIDKKLLIKNLERLRYVQDQTGCKILLALKGFSMHSTFSLVGEYLAGITSSSLFEAKLGREYMNKEVHVYAPAYRDDEFDEIMDTCDHIVFNSVDQYKHFKDKVSKHKTIECGLRVNPQYSEVETALYDPCAPNSRLGTIEAKIKAEDLEGLSGLHFHTMCEQQVDTLIRTIEVVEAKFGKYLHQMKWLNFGGGHHITKDGYDIERLIELVNYIKEKYNLQVYIEPGEAIALNCGYLVVSVLDIVDNGMKIAIIDSSASCHMPDVIEMPYRPYIINSEEADVKKYTYRLGGMTCLAGDVVGDYSFDHELKIGDKLVFTDMAHYTMVKNHMFNGVNLPSIAIMDESKIQVIREFTYEDYKTRLS